MRSILAQLQDFNGLANDAVETVVKKSLFRTLSGAESMSPVDTGTFKRSWMSSIGSPDVSTEATGSAIGRLNISLGTFKIGEIFYFTNNQPYSLKLEYGLSDQASQGMVRIAQQRFPDIVNDEIRKARV